MRSIRSYLRAPRCTPRGRAAVVLLLLPWAASVAFAAASADEPLDLAAFRGQVVYLDFWASWCAPCRESFPWMNRMQDELGRDGLTVIAVNVDRERADAERFLQAHPARFRLVFDPDGRLPEKFAVRGMPTSFLIDRNGRVQSRHQGFFLKDRAALEQQLRALLHAH